MSKTAEETLKEYAGELFCMVHSTTCEKIVKAMESYHASKLSEVVGKLKDGEHPDEINPRGKTWLEERDNWKSEVERLRDELNKAKEEI